MKIGSYEILNVNLNSRKFIFMSWWLQDQKGKPQRLASLHLKINIKQKNVHLYQ